MKRYMLKMTNKQHKELKEAAYWDRVTMKSFITQAIKYKVKVVEKCRKQKQ